MDDLVTTATYASRILPYDFQDAVRLCERTRARCAGLLSGDDLSLRFLEHVTAGRSAHVRLRTGEGAAIPAELSITPWDEDWCVLRLQPRLPALETARPHVQLAIDGAADLLACAVLGSFRPQATRS